LSAIGGVVALKPVVENLGLSWPAQQRVIKNDHNCTQLKWSKTDIQPLLNKKMTTTAHS
jgi:hypothetical protein